jgi:hypothetical protein
MASDPVPPKAKPKTWVHHKMSDDKALRILPGLPAGLTLHQVHEVPRRFQVYCDAHPEYAREETVFARQRIAGRVAISTAVGAAAPLVLFPTNVNAACVACSERATAVPTVQVFTSIIWSHSLTFKASSLERGMMPALLISTSSRPKRVTAAEMKAAIDARFVQTQSRTHRDGQISCLTCSAVAAAP